MSKSASASVKNIERVLKYVVSGYRYFMPKPVYNTFTQEQKTLFDNLYPELASKAKFSDAMADLSAVCGGVFGTVYIGVELSNIFSLITISSIFSVVAFGFMVFSLLAWVVSSIYQIVFVERKREQLIKDGGIQQVFESIQELKDKSNELYAQLNRLDNYFDQVVKIDTHQTNRHVAAACLEYIRYASNLMSPSVLQVVIEGMLKHRDLNYHSVPDSEEKQQADQATKMTHYLSQSIQFSLGDKSKNKPKTNHLADHEGMSPEFVKSWMKLVGNMPFVPFQPGDAHQIHLEYLHEINEISSAIPLLNAIGISIQKGVNLSHLSDALYPQMERVLNQFPIVAPSMPDKEDIAQLASQPRPSRLLQKPALDVPRIVAKVLVDDQSREASAYKKPSPQLRPSFIQWLKGDSSNHS